jgi:hypothetical protein
MQMKQTQLKKKKNKKKKIVTKKKQINISINKSVSVGAIVGGVIGGCSLIAFLIISFKYYQHTSKFSSLYLYIIIYIIKF